MALALRGDFDAARLRLCARQSGDADQVRRLLALAAIYDGVSRIKRHPELDTSDIWNWTA